MKRLLAILLVLAMLPVPAAFAERETSGLITDADRAAVDAMWKELENAEGEELESRKSYRSAVTVVEESTAFAVAQAVEEHPLYEEGTLRWKGEDHFTFETTVGVTCGYSVRLRNIAMSVEQQEEETPEIEQISYASENTAAAKDVYVIEPYYGIDSSFTKQYQQEGKAIAEAIGGTYTLYTKTAATVDAIADAIEQGAVVIFDSHGDTDYARGTDYTTGATTSYLLLQTDKGITEEDYAYDNGTYHAVNYGRSGSMYYYAVDGTCIANHMDNPAPGSLLWTAICLGMATDGLHAPLMEQGVSVAYGYSQSVTFGGDYCWEECFWDEMCGGAQVKDAIAQMKETYGCWDMSPEIYAANGWREDSGTCDTVAEAQRNDAAFPIVVSEQDVYPGHGNVDDLQTVYSTWTLPFGELPCVLTARSNDETLGTVSVKDNVVTAVPAEHAYVEGYELSPAGAAAVTWEGNVFTVTDLTENCTLTVNFAPYTYELTASSNDETLGTVSLQGNVVTAIPAEHAHVTGYELSPADAATVTWKDNTFTVTALTADCVLTVNFAAKPVATVHYSVPEGCLKESDTGYVGEALTLTPPEGTPTADGEDYQFLGWAMESLTDSAEMPDYVTDSFVPSQEETILYALYTYEEGGATYYTTLLRTKICYAGRYEDVDLNAWYHEALDFVLEEGYMNGTGEDTFEPSGELTRAMLATILYRMSGDMESHSHPFADVEEGKWYSDAIAWAYETGVVTGTSDTAFAPEDSVTREQAAAMFYRYAKLMGQEPEATGNLSAFKDADEISDYAKLPLRWAVGEGIISGKGNGILDPNGTATRAEIAKIIYNWIG